MVEAKQLLDYNEAVRHRYFETFTKLSWHEFIEDREASFHSLRSIFVHTLGAIDYWLDFLQKQNLHSEKDYDKYETMEQVRAYMEHVEKRTHSYLNHLTLDKLRKTYAVRGDDGKTYKVTAEDVMIHMFEEELHHRGEFIALLWQMGIEPPPMGWKNL